MGPLREAAGNPSGGSRDATQAEGNMTLPLIKKLAELQKEDYLRIAQALGGSAFLAPSEGGKRKATINFGGNSLGFEEGQVVVSEGLFSAPRVIPASFVAVFEDRVGIKNQLGEIVTDTQVTRESIGPTTQG